MKFTLTATIKDAAGNSETLSFNYQVPAVEAPSEEPVVLYYGKDNKYVTGVEYQYVSSSSGNKKLELAISENKAEAVAFTVIDNGDGTVTFKTADGKYLFCDANSVEYVAEQSDNTKFVLEAADAEGGMFIKCAVAVHASSGKAQYLEVYSGYLTCYGMGTDTSIYTFKLEDATGANGTVVDFVESEKPEDPKPEDPKPEDPKPEDPSSTTVTLVETPVAGTAYKFVMQQNGIEGKPFLGATGAMSGYYFATSETVAEMVDFYLEAVDGGYRIYYMNGDVKTYVNIVPRDNDATKTNIKYQTIEENATPSVYKLNLEFKYIYTTVNDVDWYIGTYGTNKTLSASNVSYISDTSKIGVSQFCAWFATVSEVAQKPANTVVFVDQPAAGTAYKFVMQQNGIEGKPFLGATGAMSGYYFATSETVAEMVDFYLEAVDGGYRIYYMNGDVKTYVNIVPRDNDATKTNIKYQTIEENATPSVYKLNLEFKYIYTTVNDVDWYIGTYGTNKTLSASNVSYISDTSKIGVSQFCAWFATIGEGAEKPTEPEKPAEPATKADATISFDTTANRTVFTEEQQVWVQNGITVTNDKAASTSAVADYSNPARFYQSSKLTIACTGMKSIKIYCNSKKPVTGLTDALANIPGITVTVDGYVVTITFATAVDSFVVESLAAQIRIDKIEIFK